MEMVNAFSRLVTDSYAITTIDRITKAVNLMRHYKVWNDERYCLSNPSLS